MHLSVQGPYGVPWPGKLELRQSFVMITNMLCHAATLQGYLVHFQCAHLDTLRCIHQQQRALAGGQRAADLVAEVNVPWRVDQVEQVVRAVVVVNQGNSLSLAQHSKGFVIPLSCRLYHGWVLISDMKMNGRTWPDIHFCKSA